MESNNTGDVALKLSIQAHRQFLILQKEGILRDEDFNSFALGYTFGVIGTADTIKGEKTLENETEELTQS